MPAVPAELLFRQPPKSNPAELLFGEVESLPDQTVSANFALPPLTVAAVVGTGTNVVASFNLPALTLSALIGTPVEVTAVFSLPALSASVDVLFRSNTDRPLVSRAITDWDKSATLNIGAVQRHNIARSSLSGRQTLWNLAQVRSNSAAHPHSVGVPVGDDTETMQQDALQLGEWPVLIKYQDALRGFRELAATLFQDAIRTPASPLVAPHQDSIRGFRPWLETGFQEGIRLKKHYGAGFKKGAFIRRSWRSPFQEAMRPPPGARTVVPPVVDSCYIPDPDLLFSLAAASDGSLIFICERHGDGGGGGGGPTDTIIVPIRNVYMVINNISLRRVSDNTVIPTFSLSLSIDADSWTWGFSASLPASALDAVMPSGDTPVELEASLNGTPYRVIVESIARERAFNSDAIRISGRGKNAVLAAPYAPTLTFTNTIARTAQQLMADVLTINNVPLPWSIDWELDDWLVPPGAFAVQGSYIDGLNAIASAAGAYLQPHPTLQEIRVLLRYPTAPWQWGSVVPDFELPSAVTVRESTEWIDKPTYNRVFVSGQSQGILGQVTRTGSAGDLVAPMVTDPLITQAVAARQRGIAVLGDTGRKAMLGLRLPVLQETGVILPGKFVRYTDGTDEMIGIVRGTSVEATSPEMWQTLEVETQL
ncbi:MAG: hypothetical protein ACK5OQ_16365 [Burkholderiales bacterium]|jgi:hypothetical protein